MASVSHVYNKFVQSFLDHCIFLTSLCIVTEVPVYTSKQLVKSEGPDADHATNVRISVIKPPRETLKNLSLLCFDVFNRVLKHRKGSTFIMEAPFALSPQEA